MSEWMAAGLLEDGRGTNRDFVIMSAINSNQNDFGFQRNASVLGASATSS